MVSAIKIDHVAIMVSDLEQSLRFYRDLLGLELELNETSTGKQVAHSFEWSDA